MVLVLKFLLNMKINGTNEKDSLMTEDKVSRIERTTKKARVDDTSKGHQSSIEVIDLSDSEENVQIRQQEKAINRVKEEHSGQENPRLNNVEINGSVLTQVSELDGSVVCEKTDGINNPHQVFVTEEFDSDGISDSEQPSKKKKSDKFNGICEAIKVQCSKCTMTLKNVDNNYLRFLKNCFKCMSPIIFQCQKCKKCFKNYQSIQDHLDRSCKNMQIKPKIRELALKASKDPFNNENLPVKKRPTSDKIPIVINLDSDSDAELNESFTNSESSLPIKILSVESHADGKNNLPIETLPAEEESTDSQKITDVNYDEANADVKINAFEYIDTESSRSSDSPATYDVESNVIASLPAPENPHQSAYQCGNCEFYAETEKILKRHISYMHTESKAKKPDKACSKCKRKYSSLKLKEKHEKRCYGIFYYKCKFCAKTAYVSTDIRKHILDRHSELYEDCEFERIMSEIRLKRKAAKEMFENACGKLAKTDEGKDPEAAENGVMKDRDIVSTIESDVDKLYTNFSKINELLRVRCCKCKVTFEKVEEKMILRCPDCQSELLYRCRSCDKLFVSFDEAWLHTSYRCKIFKNKQIIGKQSPGEVPKPPRTTYGCCHCDYKTKNKWQMSQHMEMWHSCLNNDDPGTKFTACSRCGRTFKKLEDCRIHESSQCRTSTLLVCEFCSKVEMP